MLLKNGIHSDPKPPPCRNDKGKETRKEECLHWSGCGVGTSSLGDLVGLSLTNKNSIGGRVFRSRALPKTNLGSRPS